EVPEAVERGQPAHAKVLRQLDHLVHLDVLAPRRRPDSRVDDAGLVEDLGRLPAWRALADRAHELPDTLLGQEEACSKSIRPHLDQFIAVRGPADQAEAVSVEEHMR